MPNSATPPASLENVDSLLAPSFAARVAQQFFAHSAHAPLTILILEWLLAGNRYFAEPDAYVLVLAALLQAGWLAYPPRGHTGWIVAGNLVGAGIYSVVESVIEGSAFFTQPQHLAFLLIAVTFSLLQGVRHHWQANAGVQQVLVLVENIARAAIPVLLYAVFEARSKVQAMNPAEFFADSAHVYLSIVVLLLGVLLGFADIALQRTQQALRTLAGRLHQMSSWGFGSTVVAAALKNADQIALRRQERVLMFMDIRGFTAWSETESPEAVVRMLNVYYSTSEKVLQPFAPIKYKFTADEVMAVFSDKTGAFEAARQLQAAAARVLGDYRLTVGIGLHVGPVVEGLLGSASVKAYEVIGDAVNTASRLCGAAGPGELLISEAALPELSLPALPRRQIEAKGKREPLAAYVVSADAAHRMSRKDHLSGDGPGRPATVGD